MFTPLFLIMLSLHSVSQGCFPFISIFRICIIAGTRIIIQLCDFLLQGSGCCSLSKEKWMLPNPPRKIKTINSLSEECRLLISGWMFHAEREMWGICLKIIIKKGNTWHITNAGQMCKSSQNPHIFLFFITVCLFARWPGEAARLQNFVFNTKIFPPFPPGLQVILPEYLQEHFVQAALSYIACNSEGEFICKDNDCWCQCGPKFPECNCPYMDIQAMEENLLRISETWNAYNSEFEESGEDFFF